VISIVGFEALLSVVPLSIGGVISLLINALLVFIVLVVVNKIIEHEMEAKHSLIMAFLALFLAPLAMAVIAMTGVSAVIPYFGIIAMFVIPLLVWILLGELLLKGDRMEKLKVVLIAFVVYFILNFIGVSIMIRSLIPI